MLGLLLTDLADGTCGAGASSVAGLCVQGARAGCGVVVGAVGLAVEATDAGGSFVAVGAHVGVLRVFLVVLLLLGGSLVLVAAVGEETLLRTVELRHGALRADDAATTQCRRASRACEGRAVGTLAPQNGGFVIVPVALAKAEAAVLGPKEEPYAGKHEASADQAEESEHAIVVDGLWIDRSSTRAIPCAVAISSAEDGAKLEGREW